MMRRAPVLRLCLVLLLAGCGQKVVQVKGVLVKDGVPFKAAPTDVVQILFLWKNEKGLSMAASSRFNPQDGSFEVLGPTANGVPPGQYRIAVTGNHYPASGPDFFKGELEDEKTPLTYTVTQAPVQNIVIDVGKKTVAPQ